MADVAPTQATTTNRRTRQIPGTTLIAAVSLIFVLPFIWIVITSLRPTEEALRYTAPFERRTLIPDSLTLDNYSNLFAGPFLRAIANSMFIACVGVAVGLLIAAAAAYVFATVDFPGRSALFGLVVFSFMIPFEVLAIPLASAVRDLDMTNSYISLILPGVGNGLAVFLLRQFFLGIPRELSEAASIDGSNWVGIFWRIYLPLSRPALISAGLMIFLFQWQAYLWPLLITTDRNYDVGSVALARFFGQSFDADYGVIFAGAAILAAVPALLLLFFQRHLVETGASTGLKG